MTIDQRMIERIQPDLELVASYLSALQAQFSDVPSSQLFDAAVKLAGDRCLATALLDIDGILVEIGGNLVAILEELT